MSAVADLSSAADGGGAGGYFAPLIRLHSPGEGAHDELEGGDQTAAMRSRTRWPICTWPTLEQCAQPCAVGPIEYLQTCPSSDGACAMVLSSSRRRASTSKPALFKAHHARSEPIFSGDQASPQAGRLATDVFAQAQIRNPLDELDGEPLRPFRGSNPWLAGGVAAPGRLASGRDGVTAARCRRTSRAACSPNPISASGMIRSPSGTAAWAGRASGGGLPARVAPMVVGPFTCGSSARRRRIRGLWWRCLWGPV